MIDLGMTPVLLSFSGNVPAALRDIFQSANITKLGDWNVICRHFIILIYQKIIHLFFDYNRNTVDGNPRWCCSFLLDLLILYLYKSGRHLLKKQIKEYGDVMDIYNCDKFNDNTPPTGDPTHISTLASAVLEAISKAKMDAAGCSIQTHHSGNHHK